MVYQCLKPYEYLEETWRQLPIEECYPFEIHNVPEKGETIRCIYGMRELDKVV